MDPAALTERMRAAASLRQAGSAEAAKKIYEAILVVNPQHAPSLYYLSSIAAERGRTADAAEMLESAIAIEPSQAIYHYAFANLMADLGESERAKASYQQAIMLKPGFAEAHNQLGLLFQGRGKLEDAERHFRAATQYNVAYVKAYNNLGVVLKSQEKLDESLACFQQALKLSPGYFNANLNAGDILMMQGRLADAEYHFERAIQVRPEEFAVYLKLAWAQIVEMKMERAEDVLRSLLSIKPNFERALLMLGYALKEQGKFEESQSYYRKAWSLDENSLAAAVGANLALPPIYRDVSHLHEMRTQYFAGIGHLEERLPLFKKANGQAIGLIWGNFLLGYQGMDDKELQQRYGNFLTELLRGEVPNFFEPLEIQPEAANRRLKIGFLSSLFRNCTVGSYFKSWITEIDKARFETFVYYSGSGTDELTSQIAAASDHFARIFGAAQQIAERVKSDVLDILVYPEIGMDAGFYTLAALRLAPVQCAAWGHPVTTGFPNIDYYFSSELMEPKDAIQHYTEKLILLDGLGTYYDQPTLPEPGARKDFGLPERRTLYFCPQSLYKIHPENDAILAAILEADENATLVFFRSMFETSTRIFMERLSNLFDSRGIGKMKRVVLLPRMNHENYLKVNQLCDVVLDTLHWSGGNTSLDAIACGKPIVTLPGKLMRGRQSFGMLSAMGITELIANNEHEYINIALRLGKDPEWRELLSQRIVANSHRIFRNIKPIRDLERFFLSLIPSVAEAETI